MTNPYTRHDDPIREFLLMDMRLEAMATEWARQAFPNLFTPSGEGTLLIISTPRGPGNSFYDMWLKGERHG